MSAVSPPLRPGRLLTVHRPGDEAGVVVDPGTPVGALLPREIEGERVIAARLDRRLVSLSTPILADAHIAPLPVSHWEGERVYRRSLGLALLEAAARCAPPLRITLGASIGFGQPITIAGAEDIGAAVARLRASLQTLATEGRPFVESTRTVEEARAILEAQGDDEGVKRLRYERGASVRLVTCGSVWVPSFGPLVPSTAWFDQVSLGTRGNEAYAVYRETSHRRWSTTQLVATAPSKKATDMGARHQQWLERLGVRGVGSLTDLCVRGSVPEMVAVSEGFHEKRVADIATEIGARMGAVRVISIAGPSSSGKTTFIKRLSTQLRVLGIVPRVLSLDDYYKNREATDRDANGEPDFEAFHALDVALLHAHLEALLAGGPVRTARFDFPTGHSISEGGPELLLTSGDVLLVEGLHGLNPALFAGLLDEAHVFRVFVNPSMSLAFDRLERVSASDVRLLRRIVRDRRERGTSPGDNVLRWPSVRRGERSYIFPHMGQADAVFDSSLVYEPCVLKVFAERYLLEVDASHPAYVTTQRLRLLLDAFVAIDPEHVPRASLLREFVG